MFPNRINLLSDDVLRSRKSLAVLVVVALAALAPAAWSERGPSPGGLFANGGPWTAIANVPDCAQEGRVCAEWPFRSNNQQYLAVCCILPGDLGSMKPPESACAGGGMLMIRRSGSASAN
ncbi:MAG: hypothetical protein AAFX50_19880 [Acidobacteriota bacterium]